jgi:beta-glucosidase
MAYKTNSTDPNYVLTPPEVDVENVGKVAGDEVAELYVVPPQGVAMPLEQLRGVERVRLGPGETQRVVFTLDARALSTVNAAGERSVAAGMYRIVVGGGSRGRRTMCRQR